MNLLSIGGSDPSSGAGIQSDIKTFSSFNVHGLTVITAITSQNTSNFGIVEPVSQKILEDQIESIMSDFKIDGIKIGVVYNSQIIKILNSKLRKIKIPIVVDPVIKSTTGGMLIEKSAISDFQKYIIPLATIITPNRFESRILSNTKISSKKSLQSIARKIQKMGAKNVVITGAKTNDKKISDFVLEKNEEYFMPVNKINRINHGSGCNYSAAIIFALAKNMTIKDSLRFAQQFTQNSIKNAKKTGKGIAITEIRDAINQDLEEAINKFVQIENIYKNIPECQINFVYSKQKPKSIMDILGISGRIVKSEKEAIVAGRLIYGGSKHVATALLVMNKKYPKIRSAINLKYQSDIISKIKKTKLEVAKYDRNKEPKNVKNKGSTIEWGIKKAVKNSTKMPDAIYHTGDFGKEPMIMVFAETPNDILKKILKII